MVIDGPFEGVAGGLLQDGRVVEYHLVSYDFAIDLLLDSAGRPGGLADGKAVFAKSQITDVNTVEVPAGQEKLAVNADVGL